MQVSTQNVKAILLALVAFLCYTIGDSLLKGVMPIYDTFFAGLMIVSAQAVIILIGLPFYGGLKTVFHQKNLKLNLTRGLFASLAWVFFIIGMQYNDLAVNYSVHLSASIWVAVLSVFFFKMVLGWHKWTAIIMGFIGVLIVMRPGTDSFELTTLFPVISAFSFATMALITRVLETEKQFTLLFFTVFANLIIVGAIVVYRDTWQAIPLEHLVIFIGAAVIYIVGILFGNFAYSIGDTAAVNPMQYSQIIWGALIGYFFFAEIPTLWTLAGASLIVLSGLYMIYREHKAEKNGTRTG